MLRFLLISMAGFSAVALASADSISKVNGGIRIEASQNVGDLSTVNGSIEVGEGAHAQEVETVNGSVQLQPRVVAESVETVNGSVRVAAEAQVLESAETVNGRITLDKRTQIGGSISTVNGDLTLDESRVEGELKTVNGDITVGADSRVGGGILVEKPHGWSHGSNKTIPKIVIGPRAVVEGTLRFEREVKLYVSRSATIGKVEGATPVMFDGEAP
jgi:DUF4097 and DUF4098 domain-containing protein YvlB